MSNNWSRFTKQARKAIGESAYYTLQFSEDFSVQPEHLLLAILDQSDCEASRLLSNMGISPIELKTKLLKLFPSSAESEAEIEKMEQKVTLSPGVKQVLEQAVHEARNNHLDNIGTRQLLACILSLNLISAGQILEETGVSLSKMHSIPQLVKEEISVPVKQDYKFTISPVFLLVLVAAIVAGFIIYYGYTLDNLKVFLFVTCGWIVSLALHEFGHALAAYLSGDYDVSQKGYLTLNPLKYTHVLRSIVYPLVFLIAGGIGLPGGAIYINRSAIPSKRKQSLVSAAGPFATLCLAMLLSVPFLLDLPALDQFNHLEFWAALAFLFYLQITAFLFNLLPIPGFDGFNILKPFLPPNITSAANSPNELTFLIVAVVFFTDNPLRDNFWAAVDWLAISVKLDTFFVDLGYDLYRFWEAWLG